MALARFFQFVLVFVALTSVISVNSSPSPGDHVFYTSFVRRRPPLYPIYRSEDDVFHIKRRPPPYGYLRGEHFSRFFGCDFDPSLPGCEDTGISITIRPTRTVTRTQAYQPKFMTTTVPCRFRTTTKGTSVPYWLRETTRSAHGTPSITIRTAVPKWYRKTTPTRRTTRLLFWNMILEEVREEPDRKEEEEVNLDFWREAKEEDNNDEEILSYPFEEDNEKTITITRAPTAETPLSMQSLWPDHEEKEDDWGLANEENNEDDNDEKILDPFEEDNEETITKTHAPTAGTPLSMQSLWPHQEEKEEENQDDWGLANEENNEDDTDEDISDPFEEDNFSWF